MMRRVLVGMVVVLLVLGAVHVPGAAARSRSQQEDPGAASQFGWGLAAVGGNLFYVPAKLLYALGGGLTGCLAWALTAGNEDVAAGIWYPSVGGTWVLTPEMMQGEEPVLFNGPSYEPEN